MCIQWTRVLQFNSLCNGFTNIWSMFVYNIGMIQMMVLLEMSFNVDSLKLFLLWYGDVIVILPETENGLKHSW